MAGPYFETAAQGITRYGLTLSGIGMAPIPLPYLAAQKAIADFLDRETARIDQFIERVGGQTAAKAAEA